MFGVDDYLIAAGVTAAASAYSASSTNATNQAIAGQNQELGVIGSLVNMGYNHDEAQLARDFGWRQMEAQQRHQQGMFNASAQESAAQAALSRQWQHDMDNTKYQRTTADMMKAGINPMLAVRNGAAAPAGSPTSSGGQVGGSGGAGGGQASAGQAVIPPRPGIANPFPNVSAMDIMRTGEQIQNMKETNKNIAADTELKKETTGKAAAETANLRETINEIKERVTQLKFQHENTDWDTRKKMSETDLNYALREMQKANTNYLLGQTSLASVQKRVASANAVLLEAEQSAASAMDTANKTWYGQNVRPYLGEIGRMLPGSDVIRRGVTR